jgi:hypothetical protein
VLEKNKDKLPNYPPFRGAGGQTQIEACSISGVGDEYKKNKIKRCDVRFSCRRAGRHIPRFFRIK